MVEESRKDNFPGYGCVSLLDPSCVYLDHSRHAERLVTSVLSVLGGSLVGVGVQMKLM